MLLPWQGAHLLLLFIFVGLVCAGCFIYTHIEEEEVQNGIP